MSTREFWEATTTQGREFAVEENVLSNYEGPILPKLREIAKHRHYPFVHFWELRKFVEVGEPADRSEIEYWRFQDNFMSQSNRWMPACLSRDIRLTKGSSLHISYDYNRKNQFKEAVWRIQDASGNFVAKLFLENSAPVIHGDPNKFQLDFLLKELENLHVRPPWTDNKLGLRSLGRW
jgi:hypothetical protein